MVPVGAQRRLYLGIACMGLLSVLGSLAILRSLLLREHSAVLQCPPLPASPRVIMYTKVPKTGSTTFIDALLPLLAARNGFELVVLEPVKSDVVDAVLTSALASGRPTLVAAHAFFSGGQLVAAARGQLAHVSFVRSPLARCASVYHFVRRKIAANASFSLASPVMGAAARTMELSFDECLLSGDASGAALPECNSCGPVTQASFFCASPGREGACSVPEPNATPGSQPHALLAWGDLGALFDVATRNAARFYSIVGLTEHYVETLEVLERTFPAFFEGAAAVFGALNVTHQRLNAAPQDVGHALSTLSGAALSRLQRVLVHEQRFYDGVRERFSTLHACSSQYANARLHEGRFSTLHLRTQGGPMV